MVSKNHEDEVDRWRRKYVPKAQIDWLAVDHYICRVIVEHGGYVLARKSVRRVTDQQTCFTDGAV